MSREMLQIGVSEGQDTRILRLTGELDSYTSERLFSLADSWLKGVKELVVNLDGLQYIDSSGLSALVAIWVKSVENGSRMTISCRNPRIHRVLEITGLLNLFTMDNTGPEARGLMGLPYSIGTANVKIDDIAPKSIVYTHREGLRR